MKNILAILCIVNFLYADSLLVYFDTLRAEMLAPPSPFINTQSSHTPQENTCQELLAIINHKAVFKNATFKVGDNVCQKKILKILDTHILLEDGNSIYLTNDKKIEINATQKRVFENIRDYNLIK